MLKIPSKLSVMLSTVLSIVLFCVCIAGAVVMPKFCEILINTPDGIGSRGDITDGGRVLVLVLAYAVLAVTMLADLLLFFILSKVRQGKVFTDGTVSLIRGVSWCCFLLCAVFAVLGYYFQLAFIIAFLAVFLGLCLRVVKNVIEEATRIKSENDLTV